MAYVYILKSLHHSTTYVGSTTDLGRRFKEHNIGKTPFTNRYKPWKIVYTEKYDNLTKARAREKYFKSAAGRRFITKHIPL